MAIRNFSESTLTAEVLKRVGKAPDPRVRKVMRSLVKHLFVKGDKYLDSDAVFGVKNSLIVNFRINAAGEAECKYDFVLKPAGMKKKKRT